MAAKTTVLLETFDKAIIEKISPFFSQLGAGRLVGESYFDNACGPSSLKPRKYHELEGRFFFWVNRFTVGQTTLDISYGDREFFIELTIYYANIADRFPVWELLNAAEVKDSTAISVGSWVLEPAYIVQMVEKLAESIRQHWRVLANPKADIIERVRILREERVLFAQREQRRRDRERACIQASAAFHLGQHAEARRLLEPFRNDAELEPSSAKILEITDRKHK
jgi:hypothetical protein